MNNYSEIINYLFTRFAEYQKVGVTAYKPGLENVLKLDRVCGRPHQYYHVIHVGGTNGKGSVSHLLAAVLQAQGYRVGLFTSPHMVDFRERIRVDGEMIPEEEVVRFVRHYRKEFEGVNPSFFEYTTMMALDYFARRRVQFAIVEVGLGGRLDSTNIVNPLFSIVTSIGFDHMYLLGNSLEEIAGEKAGIMKAGSYTILGEMQPEAEHVFFSQGEEIGNEVFAAGCTLALGNGFEAVYGEIRTREDGCSEFGYEPDKWVESALGGEYQRSNFMCVYSAVRLLRLMNVAIDEEAFERGFREVKQLTGLRGRWDVFALRRQGARAIVDVGHNEQGVERVVAQLRKQEFKRLRMVVGMVNDKEVSKILKLLPQEAEYYFTQPSIERALPVGELVSEAIEAGLVGRSFPTVEQAVIEALDETEEGDLVFVGGSSFVVADFFSAKIAENQKYFA